MTSSLSENEKFLTRHYLRIVATGKGSRAVAILIPKNLQKYFSMVDDIKHKTAAWFSAQNTYFFTYPHSNRWIDGCSVISRYAKQCGAKRPELLTSSCLRKHIATVTQVLNLKAMKSTNSQNLWDTPLGHMNNFISKSNILLFETCFFIPNILISDCPRTYIKWQKFLKFCS